MSELPVNIDQCVSQSDRKRDLIHIAVLLIIALGIGIYLIATTVLIARDGVTFIEYAKNLAASPTSTMLSQDQHPGYPFLILTAHKIATILQIENSIQSWIYSAQSTALIFRLLTVIAIYFIARLTVGVNSAFWATLILILLPKPAMYGSDALSDWPHVFFLVLGLSLLIYGVKYRKLWLFGFAGMAGGLGYLIRPECAQIIIYATFFLFLQLIYKTIDASRSKIIITLVLLFLGFITTALPYMILKKAVFPKKHVGEFASTLQSGEIYNRETKNFPNNVFTSSIVPSDIAKSFGIIVKKTSDMLMWFFVAPMAIGLYKHFKKWNWCESERCFITTLIVLNIFILSYLHCNFGIMSARHCLPLVVFGIIYVPEGLGTLAFYFSKSFSRQERMPISTKTNRQFWFLILFAIGFFICIPKLFTPLRYDKKNYKRASEWLAKHTDEKNVISVPDVRISFYAERKGEKKKVPDLNSNIMYDVQILKKQGDLSEKIACCDINIVDHPAKKHISKELFLSDFHERNPRVVSLNFPVPEGNPACEFRVYLFAGNDLTLQAINLWPTDPVHRNKKNENMGAYDILDKKHPMATQVGKVDSANGQIRGTRKGFLAYGPYIPLNKGDYKVEYLLKLNNLTHRENVPLGMSEVWSSGVDGKGEKILIYKR